MYEASFDTLIPPVIFEDDDLLLVNKLPGLLSIPDGYDPALPHLRKVLEPIHGSLWIVHRLDKDTSGVIVLAKNKEAHQKLNESFRYKQIEKKYHGLITPVPVWQEKTINLPLKVNADRKHRTRVSHNQGKAAHSFCCVQKRFELGALLEIQITTGITHQIRAHLRACNIVLFGDNLYNAGLPEMPLQFHRTMLHAQSIGFQHPTKGNWNNYIAPYPADFREAYTRLRFTKALDAKL